MLFLAILLTFSAQAQDGVLGQWKTIDDESGKAKSVVEITKLGEIYHGKIVRLIEPDEANPVCKLCEGDKANQPVEGLEIIWDIKEVKPNQEWGGGKILDPKNGKTYKCRLRLKDSGQKLEVRGFIGFSLIGRSQTWLRP